MITPLSLPDLANHFIQSGLLTKEIVENALEESKINSISFIRYLVINNILSSEICALSCAKYLNLDYEDLTDLNLAKVRIDILNVEMILHHRVIPLKIEKNNLYLGISDPTQYQIFNTICFYTDLIPNPVIVREDQLENILNYFMNKKDFNTPLELNLLSQTTFHENNVFEDNPVNHEEPVVRFVNYILQHAIQKLASDIHIEPYEKKCRIRYRQDGVLHEITEISNPLGSRVIMRLKVMAKLDITERRLPQDGRLQAHQIDIRINTCPTLYGEKIVLRLLDSNKISLNVNELGFTSLQQSAFVEKICLPHGLILVAGPTGSGKTLTLYSALNFLNNNEKNISSVEDPVEIQLPGINQVHVNPKINLHFSTVLRSFLRQDPDVLMIGEIRDSETAEIAIQAAQTGHLVLSTIHTRSAIETIARLRSMGITAYNLKSAITLVIAQRLLRKLCVYCKKEDCFSKEKLTSAGVLSASELILYQPVGCIRCQSGYHGRTGIYEFLSFTEDNINSIFSDSHTSTIAESLRTNGFLTLRDAGFLKVKAGITSLAELNRVTA